MIMSDRRQDQSAVKWLVAVLCAAAAGMSLWLTVQKLTGQIDSLVGCGSGSGCANVLGSKWSMVFGWVPVSIFSLLLYLGILGSLRVQAGWARWFRILAAWLCIWAAVWFTGLQLFVLKSICPYCMTMHGLGTVLGLSILYRESAGGVFRRGGIGAVVLAAFSVAALALVQHLGPEPETHRVDIVKVPEGAQVGETGDQSMHARGEGRLVTFLDGRKSYRVNQLPHLGSSDAEHVIVKYFDYTCDACREMDAYLFEEIATHPEKLAVIVLPVPIDRACNPHLPNGTPNHKNACELARLGLKVWRADRSKFAEFHHQLFELKDLPVEMAESLAIGLVGEENMTPEHDAWVDDLLACNVADYRIFVEDTPVMPKLLLKQSMMVQGAVKDRATLDELLKTHLGIE